MTDRHDPIRTPNVGAIKVAGSFRPNSTSGVVAGQTKGKNFTVARTSLGLYTITFDRKYPDLLDFQVSIQEADGKRRSISVGDYVAASKTLQLRVYEQKAGFIPLSLFDARELSTNAPINGAGIGGLLASDTTPALAALTSAKEIGITWAASNNDEICWNVCLPPDFNEAVAATFYARAQVTKAGGAIVDHVPLTVEAFFGTNGTDAGGDTGHITTGTMMTVSKTLTVGNQVAYPSSLMLTLKPNAHTTDSIEVGSCWLEYQKQELVDLASDADNRVHFEATFKQQNTY